VSAAAPCFEEGKKRWPQHPITDDIRKQNEAWAREQGDWPADR
jgi:hypothetical protein